MATDLAKLEIELLGIVMDRAKGREIDLSRLPVWIALSKTLSSVMIPDLPEDKDEETRRIFAVILKVREEFLSLRGSENNAQDDYFLHLASQALRSLAYRDIAVGKRFLLAAFAQSLLQAP